MSDINSSTASNVNFRTRAPRILSIALAYAFLGWMGLSLATLSAGYASPVFPAAGLALACVLWFGPRMLAGVWLGSMLLNVLHPWQLGTLTFSTAVLAVVISTGATLQAWAGSWLVRCGHGPPWRTLERERDILMFLLLGGALPGVISSSVGVIALQAFGIIEGAEFWFTAWNWYVGDVLGVLVFAPLTMCLLDREGELWRDRRRRIVTPMLITLGLVTLAFYGAARWEKQAQNVQLEADSQIVFNRIADRVIAHREVLSSLKRFIEATPDFSFEQFEVFTRITLQDNSDIFALSFNDLIADEKRPAFEGMMSRLSPLGAFQITERDAAGKLIRAMSRPEYVTVRYIVPLANNQPAVGYDIYSEPLRRDAIDRARASAAIAVTAPIRLVQEQRQRFGVLELLPVTRERALPDKEQPGRIVGFAVAVVKVDEMIEIATRGQVPAGLVFQMTDPHAPEGQDLLYYSGSPVDAHTRPVRAAHWKTPLRMGDRDWEFSIRTTEDYQRRHRSWMAWAVGVAGLLFAALLQVLMLGMTGRTSAQKRAREKLAHSYELMRYIIEHANSAVAVHDRDLRYIYVSQRYLDEYKVKERDVIGKHHYDVFPDLPQKWRDVHQRALAGEVCSADRDPYHRVDGKIDWTRWECRPWYAADGMIGGIIVYTEVITERVLEEEALRKANLVVEKSPVVLFRWRAAEGWPVAMVSQNVVQFGYTQEEFLSGAVPFASIVHPEDLDRVRREVQEYSAGAMDRFRQEYRIVTKNGEVRWVDDRTIVERNTDGQIDYYQGIVIDITERKLAEEALRDSEERYRALFEGAAEGIAVADLGTKLILYANPSYCEMYGYSVEQLVQLRVEDLHPTESLAEVVAEFEAQARGHKTLATNIPCLRKDGSVFFVDINTRPMVIAGRPVVVGFFTDITERKRAEAALRALSVRQQAMLAAIPDILMEVDHRRIYTWANQAGLDFFGADVLGREASAYFEGEQNTYNTVEPLFQGGEEVIYVESWQRRRDGQKRLLAWWCRVLKDEQGRVTGALSSARDITDAKQAEAALRESEERFSVFMTHLPASAFIKDAEGRMVFANRYLQELFGIQDYAGKTTPELIPGELAVQMTEDDRRALAEGILSTQETFRDTQGRERTFETLKFPIHTTGKPVRLGGVALDITGLKQTEAALRASLEEKTALLQEVHHRVKNNLQIVSSLLNLQASQEKSQPVLAALRETQNRVRSMAMLHEMLYRSESLARINIAAYLEGLCAHLFRAFGADPERVRLDCRTTAVELGLAQAVPCGLIVNELVSNALEHAFPQGRAGRITVEMRRDADDRLVLGVADDGVGLPAGLDFSQTATLGLQLVRILTTQLKGTLGVSRGQGSAFQVTFPSC